MISINERAAIIVRQMIDEREAHGIKVIQLDNGATVVDAGIDAPGSFEAGRLFAVACMGGLGQITIENNKYGVQESGMIGGFWPPAVTVQSSCPPIACMAAQYAGWAIKQARYFAIGSGPARALYANEQIYKTLEYRDKSETAVLMLEGRELPGEEIAVYVAEKCGVKTDHVILLVAPTASLVGSIQIAARIIETGLHKLGELGFDIRKVRAAFGTCPLAPVAKNDMHAIGRTNDAILYGGQVFYTVDADDLEIADLIEKVPSCSSQDYGMPFYELFMRYKGDFFKIDRMLFSPAQVQINNLKSGHVFCSGRLNLPLLQSSFY